MANEIERFDPSTLMQGVRDRIKATFVSLIPDSQWDEMVRKEIVDFFEAKDTGYTRENKSNFQILARNELAEWAKKKMVEYLESEEMKGVWDAKGRTVASDAVKKMIIENSGIILEQMYGRLFSEMLQSFASSLRNRQY